MISKIGNIIYRSFGLSSAWRLEKEMKDSKPSPNNVWRKFAMNCKIYKNNLNQSASGGRLF